MKVQCILSKRTYNLEGNERQLRTICNLVDKLLFQHVVVAGSLFLRTVWDIAFAFLCWELLDGRIPAIFHQLKENTPGDEKYQWTPA